MKFHKTSINLAGLYLAIMMAISLFFSWNVYRLSVLEFRRDLNRQENLLQRDIAFISPDTRDSLIQEREQQYDEARNRVLASLAVTNLFILLAGGVLSYYLARRTLQPIEESHARLERFTADASHELRTPIAAMRSEIEVALMDPRLSLAEAKKRLQSNLEELTKLTNLSEGLLRLARLERSDLKHARIALEAVLTRAMDQILPQAEQKNILIHVPQSVGLEVRGDAASLEEVFIIVLDNAVKYSPGKSEITLVAKKEHGQAVIDVRDQGIGLKPSDLERIFERFYRADAARSKQDAGGYGLGLAIAKNIIDLHGGSITAGSNHDRGATFTIRLPLAEA